MGGGSLREASVIREAVLDGPYWNNPCQLVVDFKGPVLTHVRALRVVVLE